MPYVSCLKCGIPAERGSYSFWVVLCSILLFPFGMLAMLAGRKLTSCPKCGFTWHA